MAGRLQVKSADGVAARKTAGSGAPSMRRAIQGSPMKPESELIRLVPTKVFADLLLLLLTLRLIERVVRTRELHCWKCTS
jgi:hypothetical protein